MRKPLKPLYGLFIFVVLISSATLIFNLTRPRELVVWQTDWTAARTAADAGGRPFLAYFTATWCAPCEEMKHTTWADARVRDALASYHPTKVDGDERKDLMIGYEVDSFPTLLLIGPGGEVVRRTSGYLSADELLAWLNAPATRSN